MTNFLTTEEVVNIRCKYLGKRKIKILITCLFIYCSLVILYNYMDALLRIKNCHHERIEMIDGGIPDVLNDNEEPPPKGTSIFFHETSCNNAKDKVINISPRQACAVESAAIHNPNSTIYLLYTSPVRLPNASRISTTKYRVLNELLKYKNIKIRRVFLHTYTKDTPLEEWYKKGQLKKSNYYVSHTSDILRYLSLWKFGGTYLDLDVVVMKSLEKLPPNYAGAESNANVAAGVLNLDHENFGHALAEMCLHELSTNFKGDDWGNNGPGVITRILRKICQADRTYLMTTQRCKGFTVYKTSYFYPIFYKEWKYFFDPSKLISVFNSIRDSYVIHLWNKFSSDTSVMTRGKDVAYGAIARTHCPNVFRQSGDIF